MSTCRVIDTTKVSDRARLLSRMFEQRIVGQEEGVAAFTNLLDKYLSGFYDHSRPIGSVLFLGPTGTGKTSATEAFAEGVYGDPKFLIKVDCGEYQHSHDIAKLIGSPPGYLGHRETHPLITNERLATSRTPDMNFNVILFDEIEKASDALWTLLLGILDKGTLTTGTNEVVDFRKSIIVMTSNVGSQELAARAGDGALGFSTIIDRVSLDVRELKEIARAAARRKFTPEFLNRIDETVMFNTLTQEDISRIFWLEMDSVNEMISESGNVAVMISPSPAAIRQILKEGYDRRYNARNLRRTIEKQVTTPAARAVSSGQAINGDKIVVDYNEGKWSYYAECVVSTERLKHGLVGQS